MDLARVRVNDTGIDLTGDLLANDQPYTETLLNSAWRWIQTRSANAGVETVKKVVVLQGIPVAFTLDPANQAMVCWSGCTDGVNDFDSPRLPADFYLPLEVYRRQSPVPGGVGGPFLEEMNQTDDGLRNYLSSRYDWREDALYFNGRNVLTDLWIRYSSFRPALTLDDPTQLVPLMRCENSLSARVAYEFANMRGAAQAASLATLADAEFDMISLATTRKNQRRSLRRKPFSRGSRRGLGMPGF
jgi:hypothetical protein